MAQALKDIFFQPKFFEAASAEIKQVYPSFDQRAYLESVFDDQWEAKELKQRMIHGARMLRPLLPGDIKKSLEIISQASKKFTGFDAIMFCQFVEEFGLEEFEASMKALEISTVEASAEGAIRPFIQKYPKKAMAQMLAWSKHPNEHVRRLASEGCRPLLPWNIRLHEFVKDPTPILPILKNLKDDPSEYVRKSVANNLNDISKHHPDLVLDLSEKWIGEKKNTDKILKHALRTLLKKGNSRALALFGYSDSVAVEVKELKIEPKDLAIGDQAFIDFSIKHSGAKPTPLRLEYILGYRKANGSLSPKVFQISEKIWQPEEDKNISKKHSFKDMTTRKHHPGRHSLAIAINGKIRAQIDFVLR